MHILFRNQGQAVCTCLTISYSVRDYFQIDFQIYILTKDVGLFFLKEGDLKLPSHWNCAILAAIKYANYW